MVLHAPHLTPDAAERIGLLRGFGGRRGRLLAALDQYGMSASAEEGAAVEIEVEPSGEGRPGRALGGVELGTAVADDGERVCRGADRHDLLAGDHAAARSANFA